MGVLKTIFITIPCLAVVGTGGFFIGRGALCNPNKIQWKQATTTLSLYANRNFTMDVSVDSKTYKIYCCDDVDELADNNDGIEKFYTKSTAGAHLLPSKYDKDGNPIGIGTSMISYNSSYGTLGDIQNVISSNEYDNFEHKFFAGNFVGKVDANKNYTITFDIVKRVSKITYKNENEKTVTLKFSNYGTTKIDTELKS